MQIRALVETLTAQIEWPQGNASRRYGIISDPHTRHSPFILKRLTSPGLPNFDTSSESTSYMVSRSER
jgi:Tfp pilus assembly protein FimV